jgi:uncharacterized membrane protein
MYKIKKTTFTFLPIVLLVSTLFTLFGSAHLSLADDEDIGVIRQPVEKAKSYLKICNRANGSGNIDFAYAYWHRGAWKSQGWLRILPNRCRDIAIESYEGDVRWYAQSEDGKKWTSADLFCVMLSRQFQNANSKPNVNGCVNPWTAVGMRNTKVQSGVNRTKFLDLR